MGILTSFGRVAKNGQILPPRSGQPPPTYPKTLYEISHDGSSSGCRCWSLVKKGEKDYRDIGQLAIQSSLRVELISKPLGRERSVSVTQISL